MLRAVLRLIAFASFLLVMMQFVLPLAAQAPVYVITVGDQAELSGDGTQIILRVEVSNRGSDATETTTVRLIDPSGLTNLNVGAPLRPLRSGESETLSLNFPADLFEPDSRQPLSVDVSSGGIPVTSVTVTVQMPSAGGGSKPPSSGFTVPLFGIQIDTSDPAQITLLIGMVGAAVILLLIILIILRLVFQRAPSFGTWQPPYANMPVMGPDTVAGRRQLWQQHAQNGTLPPQCSEGVVHARKLLMGMDGVNLSGWRIIAMRMSQYDMYGRVARSQILASKGVVRRLDGLARKSHTLDVERITKQARPLARSLAKQYKKKINKRSAMLPIALDIRMQGTHGEVRIVFELYQCQKMQWQLLDQWEPEMTVLSKAIHDSYTYTIFGQAAGETAKEFRQRLDYDIARALVELVTARPTTTRAPDTLRGMQPVET